MRTAKFLIFYVLLTCSSVRGSKIEQAYEALHIYDYFKAKKLFYSELKKNHKAAAAYGLATIYHRKDNPFSNSDSASKYITLAGNFYKLLRLQESYSGFKIDSNSILVNADSIAQKALLKAFQINNIKTYEDFLLSNPYANYAQKSEALYLRDELNYKTNLSYNRSDSTKSFMLRFPESHFHKEYLVLHDKQIFEEQTPLKNAEQFNAFISRFPKNKFTGQAQDELFEIYRKNDDLQGLDFYITNYKNSHFINEAWKLLYALTVKSYNNEELQSFVKNYPDFPFKESIHREIELNNKIMIAVNDNDFVGFIDTAGKYQIEPIYDEATEFREGLAVVSKNDSVFFINKINVNVFNSFYSEAYSFVSGNAPVNIDGKWFLINRQGQKTAGPFEDLSEQNENIYIIKSDGKYGAADVYGNIIISPQFDRLGDFSNGYAYFINNGLYGFISKTGLASKARYQWISDFDENKTAVVKMNNLYGLINEHDSLVISPRYDLVIKADNGTFILVKNNKYGFFSLKGCFLSEIDFDYKKEMPSSYYTNGKAFKLLKNKQQALMDANGRISVDYGIYEEVSFAQSNLIRIKRKNKYGFADRKLAVVIPCKYNSATDFTEGISICGLKQDNFLLNTKGEILLKTTGKIIPVYPGYFYVADNEGGRIVDGKGQKFVSGVNEWELKNNYLIVELENKSKKVFKLY